MWRQSWRLAFFFEWINLVWFFSDVVVREHDNTDRCYMYDSYVASWWQIWIYQHIQILRKDCDLDEQNTFFDGISLTSQGNTYIPFHRYACT